MLFNLFPRELLKEFEPFSVLRKYPAGKKVLKEGNLNTWLYFIVRGTLSVKVEGNLILKLRRKGDLFGEMSVISGNPCSATVIADEEVELLALNTTTIKNSSEEKIVNLRTTLYKVFALILTDKLYLTTLKAQEFEKSNINLENFQKKLVAAQMELKELEAQLIQTEKLTALGKVATGISHELTQPLFDIKLLAESVIEDWSETPTKLNKHKIEQILQHVNRCSTIIKHLGEFGRDARNVKRTTNDLNKIIKNSVSLVAEKFKKSGLKIKHDFAKELLEIDCNSVQIEQVITNLLLNAEDALDHTKDKRIFVRTFFDNGYSIVEVRDNGKGLSKAQQRKVFDPFFTTKKLGEGMGLGLSISLNIIKNHGGTIDLESQEGKGTAFRIKLPLAKKQGAEV